MLVNETSAIFPGNCCSVPLGNFSGNNSANANIPAVSFSIFMAILVCLSFVISIAIVIVNVLYVVCLYINRKKDWFSHSKNILSLAVVDIIVGITSTWITIISSITNVNYYVCVFSQSMCLSAQVTNALSILRLCILRLIAVGRSVPARESTAVSIILQTILTYLLSSVLCYLPVMIWSKYSATLHRCTWGQMFGGNVKFADKYMLSVMIIPTMLTTTLYTILCFYIRKKLITVCPLESSTALSDMTQRSRTNILSKSMTPNKTQPSQTTSLVSSPNNSSSNAKDTLNVSNERKNDLQVTTIGGINGKGTFVRDSIRKPLPKKQVQTRRVATTIMSARYRRMSGVVKTIGMVLLCSIISIAPYVIVLCLKIVRWPVPVDPYYGFVASFFLMFNSIADPLVYAMRLKHLKEAYIQMVCPCSWRSCTGR